ncbi:single-strand binding protein [Lishizhenia tianjinensis]|uniref:Single-stranded DNA-binding protein n=1 Tax=Lishizhenia tianjinensis TaxID=477690 RepID=A0A1I7BRR5_9FLAO|nr:single-stranded DNA-binding protein [Lishizhenia tianjinensis]SFT89862.1 single-strand binding protein [Lishizhenia tianjinensis]
MNNLRNNVQLIGRLGIDPELREFKAGRKMAKFTLAINESYRDKNGEWVKNTSWHKIVAWGNSASSIEGKLSKGVEIILDGKLVNNDYVDKNGEKHYTTQIEMQNFVLIKENKENQTSKN